MAKQKKALGDTVLLLEGLEGGCGGGYSGDFSRGVITRRGAIARSYGTQASPSASRVTVAQRLPRKAQNLPRMEFAEPEFDNYDFLDSLSASPTYTKRKTRGKKRGKCLQTKQIIDKWGRRITRCAKYSGGSRMAGKKRRKSIRRKRGLFGSLGQGGGFVKEYKPQLEMGALAAGGIWVSQSLGEKVGKMLNVAPGSMTSSLLTIVSGLVLGTVVAKVMKKKDWGAAVGMGAVAMGVYNLIGTRGGTAGLGVITTEPAPYFQQVSPPPVASFPTASNLYTDADVGIAAAVI